MLKKLFLGFSSFSFALGSAYLPAYIFFQVEWVPKLHAFSLVYFSFFSISGTVVPMLEAVMAVVPVEKLAVHFHDTYGQSLPNILISLQVSPMHAKPCFTFAYLLIISTYRA